MSKRAQIGILFITSLMFLGSTFLFPKKQVIIASTGDWASKSVNLNTYNTWGFVASPNHQNPTILQQTLQTFARHESITYAEAPEHVNNTAGWSKLTPSSIKNINPSAKVYRTYGLNVKPIWDTDWTNHTDMSRMAFPVGMSKINDPNNVRGGAFDPNATDDWWLRDDDNTIIKESNGNQLVDVGRVGVKEAFTEGILSRNAGKGFDGFVFDYWWPHLHWLIEPLGHSFPLKKYTDENQWFSSGWQPFIQYLSDQLHQNGYEIIGNCAGQSDQTDPMIVWQRSRVDGTIYEQWAVDWPQNGSKWLPSDTIAKRIDAFNKDALMTWTADYGLKKELPDFNQKKYASLAMYYIAIPQDQSRHRYHYYYDMQVYWDPLWDFNIGTPIGQTPTKMNGKFFWSRFYSDGLSLLNYEPTSTSYTLDKTYVDPDGKVYKGTINLPGYTGLILKVPTGLSVYKSSSPSQIVRPANEITYNMRVENPIASPITNININDTIPSGTTFMTGSQSAGCIYIEVASQISCYVSSLPPGEFINYSFKVRVN